MPFGTYCRYSVISQSFGMYEEKFIQYRKGILVVSVKESSGLRIATTIGGMRLIKCSSECTVLDHLKQSIVNILHNVIYLKENIAIHTISYILLNVPYRNSCILN